MRPVIGSADRNNGEPAADPVSPAMLLGTVLHTLFDPGQPRVTRDVPREIAGLVEAGQPIRELF